MNRTFLFFTAVLLLIPALSKGQHVYEFAKDSSYAFEGNNFRWHQSTNGLLFYFNKNGSPGLEVPIGEENHTVFAHALWIGGLKEGNPMASFSYFRPDTSCYEKWGPLDHNAETSLSVAGHYSRFWFVTREEIETHLGYFDCFEDPSCNVVAEYPAYQIPETFETWPAHGPDGYAEYLAPFYDYNGNGIYDPENGDHPAICGDFSTYQITNDSGTENSVCMDEPMGLEIHTRVYGYDAETGAVFNTLFVQQKIINRSTNTYMDAYFSTFTDFDVGDPFDDLVGTDVQRSMYFGYNGAPYDGSSSAGPGYGFDLPMMGVRYLGGPFLDADGEDNPPVSNDYPGYAHQAGGWGDGILDNERWGLSSSLYYLNAPHPIIGDAEDSEQVYNWMAGLWRDGTARTFGGDGYNPDSDITAKYFFPGDSDPLWLGTGGVDPNYPHAGGWTEENEGNPPSDRRMVGTTGPFTFAPGDEQFLDYAFIFARQSHNPDLELREILNQYADEIVGMECDMLPNIITGVQTEDEFEIGIYPNPASGALTVASSTREGSYTLFDIRGRKVLQGQLDGPRTAISVKNLSAGMYVLHVLGKKGDTVSGQAQTKVMVE